MPNSLERQERVDQVIDAARFWNRRPKNDMGAAFTLQQKIAQLDEYDEREAQRAQAAEGKV